MAALTSSLSLSPQYTPKDYQHHGSVVEEIVGLIRVHKDGYVERPQIVPCVTADLSPELNVTSRDIVIDKVTNTWARFYVPIPQQKLPLLVYFHGGGFCVGSAAWSCYHDFLARLSVKVGCLIMSVNYRLAPENPLPAPYDDGLKAVMWVKQQMLYQYEASEWWTSKCNFSSIFLGGDSAGANIACNVATRLAACEGAALRPLNLKGLILIQPFFGGEVRTVSEKCMAQSPGSALNLAASDTYWRLALPYGADRDHPWCNPLVKGSLKFEELKLLPTLVCISEMDILKDRNLEFCDALSRAGKIVECVVFKGVGHAFQILSKSQLSKSRTHEMMARVKSFIGL
ncbi:probable carboxylesterase 17 [Gastrolobium bilobum]|uniref:probable carboxylesterase 17 n=1 Tax=Gastrolobium bilobum TaxID=150636 RepID=UPI002AB20C58|nr:probable carboxylesterase 17 [Gastrolobium bilobum]